MQSREIKREILKKIELKHSSKIPSIHRVRIIYRYWRRQLQSKTQEYHSSRSGTVTLWTHLTMQTWVSQRKITITYTKTTTTPEDPSSSIVRARPWNGEISRKMMITEIVNNKAMAGKLISNKEISLNNLNNLTTRIATQITSPPTHKRTINRLQITPTSQNTLKSPTLLHSFTNTLNSWNRPSSRGRWPWSK